MTPLRKKEQLQTELVGLRQLAAITPDDALAKALLADRLKEAEEALRSLSEQASVRPETEILFGGTPVVGSQGIDAKFAAHILDSYQDMVTNDFASRYGALRHTGRRHGEAESRVYLTALPRGSVGLQISQPVISDFVTAMHVAEAMDHVTGLVQSASEGDTAFEEALEVFHPRVLAPLSRFLDVMAKTDVSCRILAPSRDVKLGREQIRGAYARVAAAKTEIALTQIEGTFGGILLHSWRFDLQPHDGSVISGWLAEAITDTDAARMALMVKQRVVALLNTTLVSTTAGKKRPVYELVALRSPDSAEWIGVPQLELQQSLTLNSPASAP